MAKTSIIIFYRRKLGCFRSFKDESNKIGVISDYVYPGITMNNNNKFDKKIKTARARS